MDQEKRYPRVKSTFLQKSKYKHLLDDLQVRRWFRNFLRGSAVTAANRLRRLGWLCEHFDKTPQEMAKLSGRKAVISYDYFTRCSAFSVSGKENVGVDVPAGDFLGKVRQVGAQIGATSVLLTTTAAETSVVLEGLKKAGIREKVKVIIGGVARPMEKCSFAGAHPHRRTNNSWSSSGIRMRSQTASRS